MSVTITYVIIMFFLLITYVYIEYTYLGKFDHDTTSLSSLTGIMVDKGNHPQMALIQVSEI